MLSQRETLILTAALNPQANIAARSWQEWAATQPLEDAFSPELRLLPAVLANLSQVAPTLELPKKVHGLAKMAFAKSRHLVFYSSDIIAELSKFCPVLLTKGLAMLIRFDAWSSRPMADIDIHVPPSALSGALDILAQSGWEPRYGMTFESLRYRSSLRRESWNFTKGPGHLDLHWRLSATRINGSLESQMWETAEPVEFAGQKLLLQSPEYAFVTTLHHGFLQGRRSDTLQTIVDAAWLLPLCNDDVLSRLIRKADLLKQAEDLTECLRVVGVPSRIPILARGSEGSRQTPRSRTPLPTETALLHRPSLYRLWNTLGRRSRIERFLLKWTGPFSKPLNPRPPRSEYDLRDCATMDEIAGPGWSWPEPDHSCFWTDRIDARLLVPLSSFDDHLIVIYFDERTSLNAQINIFANGVFMTRKHHMARLASAACCLMVPRRLLFGPWIEISLRPRPYLGASEVRATALSAPASRLCVLNLQHVTEGGFEISPLDIVRQLTTVSELPALPQSPSGPDRWEFMEGLNTQILIEPAVVPGQRALRLVAVGADGRHALGARFGTLAPGGVYRVVTWVKAQPGVRVMIEVRDTFDPHTGNASNYGVAQFDLDARTIAKSSGDILASGIDAATDGWVKLWADLRSKDGQLHVLLGLLESPNNRSVFTAAGQKVTFGGFEISPARSAQTLLSPAP